MISARRALSIVLVGLSVSVASATARDGSIDEAVALYYAASYSDALSALDHVHTSTKAELAEVEKYRAACLVALGRLHEAEESLERVVTLVPDLEPDRLELSPRIAELFASVRARVLPWLQREELTTATSVGAATQEPPQFYTVDDPDVTRPIALYEQIPEPPSLKGVDFTGTALLQVDISRDGIVASAILKGSVHPVYAVMIENAAKTWRYHPASVNAEPVNYRKVLQIDIS
jgi:tetratricopeptide (TPR) repeat protein